MNIENIIEFLLKHEYSFNVNRNQKGEIEVYSSEDFKINPNQKLEINYERLRIDESINYGIGEPSLKTQQAANNLWHSVTDMLTQQQIDRIEKLHKKELGILGVE